MKKGKEGNLYKLVNSEEEAKLILISQLRQRGLSDSICEKMTKLSLKSLKDLARLVCDLVVE